MDVGDDVHDRMIYEWAKKLWHDPVWSKVFSAGIVAAAAVIGLWLMSVLGKVSPRGMILAGVCGAFFFLLVSLAGYGWQFRKSLTNASPPVVVPKSLSYEEQSYREALRKFVMSNLSDINASFWQLMGGIENQAGDNTTPPLKEKMRSLVEVFIDLMNNRFGIYYKPLSDTANLPTNAINAKNLGLALHRYLEGYRDAQNYLRVLLDWINIDPNQGDVGELFRDWLNADRRGLDALHDLKTFPQATSLAASMDDGFFVSANGSLAAYKK